MRHVWSVLFLSLFLVSCGPKAFTEGEYDDPNRVELLDDRFNEADMQQMAEKTVVAMTNCPVVVEARRPPSVIVDRVENRTEEHIDTLSLTDKIRTQLIKSRKFRFINKEARSTLDEEYNYNESGAVAREKMKKRGKQTGADYMLGGRLSTNVQQVGGKKFIYYKLTMNLTNLESSEIDCVEEKEIRKAFTKKTVGL